MYGFPPSGRPPPAGESVGRSRTPRTPGLLGSVGWSPILRTVRDTGCQLGKTPEPSSHGAGAHLPAPGGRQRKLLACALRVCRPRLRHSAASTISRGSPSSTDRLPALRFRHSRGPAQRPLQATAVVQLEVDTSSTRALQSISGACCTFPRPLFGLTFQPHRCSQEAACADPDLR